RPAGYAWGAPGRPPAGGAVRAREAAAGEGRAVEAPQERGEGGLVVGGGGARGGRRAEGVPEAHERLGRGAGAQRLAQRGRHRCGIGAAHGRAEGSRASRRRWRRLSARTMWLFTVRGESPIASAISWWLRAWKRLSTRASRCCVGSSSIQARRRRPRRSASSVWPGRSGGGGGSISVCLRAW